MKILKFLILDADREETPRNRVFPVAISLPEEMPPPPSEKIKDWASNLVSKKLADWRWVKKFVLSESDASHSPEIRRMFESVAWETLSLLEVELPGNPSEAYEYVLLVNSPVPCLERVIARDTQSSYRYAMDFVGAKFPEGEQAIANDPVKSLNYARKAKSRITCAEDKIAKNEDLARLYGDLMNDNGLWGSWTEEDVARSSVWMYQYAKDHVRGPLPETLHNAMHLMSIVDSSNKWIKKYFSAKKYRPKK
jgi:hypothetical protein